MTQKRSSSVADTEAVNVQAQRSRASARAATTYGCESGKDGGETSTDTHANRMAEGGPASTVLNGSTQTCDKQGQLYTEVLVCPMFVRVF